MKFTLEINMGNAAFAEGGSGNEIARILSELARRIADHSLSKGDGWALHDINGNKVGAWATKR